MSDGAVPTGTAADLGPAREPAGVYVHVPFCSAVCPYCDFAVRKLGPGSTTPYLDALLAELAGLAAGRGPAALAEPLQSLVAGDFDTLYLGGGTPSVLSEDELARLLAALRATLTLHPETRLFLEANPEDVDAARLAAWRAAGVATLSLGVQSFDDAELRFLGRRHSGGEAAAAVELAKAAGFATLSVDLIYGLPGQQLAAWRVVLERAVALEPDHLSLYELEIHERTVFGKRHARGLLSPLPQDDQAELFLFTHAFLADHGYQGYEVSNFARAPEHRSRHNAKYWHQVPYLGLGPAAHSYAGRHRWWQHRQEAAWRRAVGELGHGIEAWEQLAPRDVALEALMLGLRTEDGVDLGAVERELGHDLRQINASRLEQWQEAGLVALEGARVRPTRQGYAVADRLAAELDLG